LLVGVAKFSKPTNGLLELVALLRKFIVAGSSIYISSVGTDLGILNDQYTDIRKE